MGHCFYCGNPITLTGRIGRAETCQHCGWDLHTCRNCRYYDPQAYNACRETQAERVLDKERANFCDFFVFPKEDREVSETTKAAPSTREKLEALFKK